MGLIAKCRSTRTPCNRITGRGYTKCGSTKPVCTNHGIFVNAITKCSSCIIASLCKLTKGSRLSAFCMSLRTPSGSIIIFRRCTVAKRRCAITTCFCCRTPSSRLGSRSYCTTAPRCRINSAGSSTYTKCRSVTSACSSIFCYPIRWKRTTPCSSTNTRRYTPAKCKGICPLWWTFTKRYRTLSFGICVCTDGNTVFPFSRSIVTNGDTIIARSTCFITRGNCISTSSTIIIIVRTSFCTRRIYLVIMNSIIFKLTNSSCIRIINTVSNIYNFTG